MIEKITSFGRQCIRVWHILRKPSQAEFKATAKVSAIGLLIIGFLGFLISVFMSVFK